MLWLTPTDLKETEARLAWAIREIKNTMSANKTDLDKSLADLKTALDAAVIRDTAVIGKLKEVQAALDELTNNPPAAEDLADEVATVKGLVTEAQTIAAPATPVTPPTPPAA